MRVVWLSPLAWLGLLSLAVPVVIHLLTKQTARPVPFPSLRFVRTTRLAALRRRSIQEWWLLAVRIAILSAATAALAGPVLVSASRERAWKSRVATAFVIVPSTESDRSETDALVQGERTRSFISQVFAPDAHVADGIRDAVRWLDGQSAGGREVVIVGDLRLGRMTAADLAVVPNDAGIRFLPVVPMRANRQAERRLANHSTRWRAQVSLADTSTGVTYLQEVTTAVPVTVRAAPGEQAFAAAALEAVLARGISMPAGRRAIVVFAGGSTQDLEPTTPVTEPWMRNALASLPGWAGAQHRDALVVQIAMRAAGAEAVQTLERVVDAVFAEEPALEPVPVSADVLAAWSRPMGQPRAFRPGEQADRRWIWAMVLLLLGAEAVIRRSHATTRVEPTLATEERVA